MPKLRPAPPVGQVEKELMDALNRLIEGKPSHPDLVKAARLKKLRINATTVAKEANRARSLIGHDGCPYPKVRTRIKQHEKPSAVPSTLEEVNRNLREDNAELRKTVSIAASRMAAMIQRMNAVDKAATKEINNVKRAAASRPQPFNVNEVAGARLLKTTPGTVLSFPNLEDPKNIEEWIMPTPSIVPKLLPLLEEYLEKLDFLWESQSVNPRAPTLPLTIDGKVNVTAITAALKLKESSVQHFYKHKELADAVNVLCDVQGVKRIGSRAIDVEHDKIVHDRQSRVSKQANELARQSAEREALLQAYRRENEKLREQLRMLEQTGMLLRQQVIH